MKYAATWSHQNFVGLTHENMNDINALKIEGETAESFKALLKDLKRKILEYAAPKLGHAQAGTIPDEPYREWKYNDHKGKIFHNDRQWFKTAVEVIKEPDKPDRYERKTGFETSNWKYFHDAAAFHRFTALHEVLPANGIICG